MKEMIEIGESRLLHAASLLTARNELRILARAIDSHPTQLNHASVTLTIETAAHGAPWSVDGSFTMRWETLRLVGYALSTAIDKEIVRLGVKLWPDSVDPGRLTVTRHPAASKS